MTPPEAPRPPLPQPRNPRLFKTPRVIIALMLRELEQHGSRTSLGFAWAFVEPAATIALMSLIFSLLIENPPYGSSFALFYLTGIAPFSLCITLAAKVAAAPRLSRPLLNTPAVRPLDTILARFLLHSVIEVAVLSLLGAALVLALDLSPVIDAALVLQAGALALLVGLGIGCLNAVLFAVLPAWELIWSVVSRPLMLVSGVLLPLPLVPLPYQPALWWNPLAHPVEMMRAGFYPQAGSLQVSGLYAALVALACLVAGLIGLQRSLRDAMEA